MQTRRAAKPTVEEAEALAIAALTFLASEPDRLGAFLAETGLEPGNMRAAARDPGFKAAILDYFLGNEAALLEFASDQGIDPARIAVLRQMLPGARTDY